MRLRPQFLHLECFQPTAHIGTRARTQVSCPRAVSRGDTALGGEGPCTSKTKSKFPRPRASMFWDTRWEGRRCLPPERRAQILLSTQRPAEHLRGLVHHHHRIHKVSAATQRNAQLDMDMDTTSPSDDVLESPTPTPPTPVEPAAPAASPSNAIINHVVTRTSASASNSPRGSAVWLHFQKRPDFRVSKRATCMHCGKTLVASHGSTSSMIIHLQRRHPIRFAASTGADSPNR